MGKHLALYLLLLAVGFSAAFAGGSYEAEGFADRGAYLTEEGIITPPGEVKYEQFIASLDYEYPVPAHRGVGLYVYTGNRRVPRSGGSEVIQIGVRGGKTAFAQLPPLNLAFVIDTSGSMADDNKIAWAREALTTVVETVRPDDFLSLVAFSDDAMVLLPSTPMSARRATQRFSRRIQDLTPDGGTNLRAGLEAGYLEVMKNYRSQYVNRVIFLSDGVGNADGIAEVASRYRELGVNVSTVGLGTEADLAILGDVARAGGGSSRFLADRDKLYALFTTDFDRMVVPAAREMTITLQLSEHAELVDTWGYQHRAEGSTVRYSIPTLHNGDYETIVASIAVRPTDTATADVPIATVTARYATLDGADRSTDTIAVATSVGEDANPVFGYSDARVARSAGMIEYVRTLKSVGTEVYGDPSATIRDQGGITTFAELPARVVESLWERVRHTRNTLVGIDQRLEADDFREPIETLDLYLSLLESATGRVVQGDEGGETVGGRYVALDAAEPSRSVADHLNNLFSEVSLQLNERYDRSMQRSAPLRIAFSYFHVQESTALPREFAVVINRLINESARGYFARDAAYEVISADDVAAFTSERSITSRDLLDTVTAVNLGRDMSAGVFLTGTVMELGASFTLFCRIVDVATARIVAATQIVIDRESTLTEVLGL